jgi:hypothetical protein
MGNQIKSDCNGGGIAQLPEVNVTNPPDIETIVHKDSRLEWVAINILDQMSTSWYCSHVDSQVRVHQKNVHPACHTIIAHR